MVMNQPGVLAHISGMLASRAFNIESLAVGETEKPDFSRITFVVAGDDKVLSQVRKQLEKIITVVKVVDFQNEDVVERDLMLVKVSTQGDKRAEIRELVDIFRGKIVDVGHDHVMIEISGQESKLTAFVELMRPFGIIELVRTGRIALSRSSALSVDLALQPPQPYEAAEVGG
jgi:acetolactate synthase-1/3 small subunit